jgi:putative RNA 2'-phosphotransferase
MNPESRHRHDHPRHDAGDVVQTSKKLSWLLRHGAPSAGVAMDAAGWVAVDDVLRALAIDRDELERTVRENTKSRLELDGARIRASQGHSIEGMPVTREALEASWEPWTSDASIWHGTATDPLPLIARDGLLPVSRTHVHLAEATDSKVGKRGGVAVLLEVSPPRMRARGLEIFRSPNGVLLARAVPPGCIVGLEAVTRAARAAERELRALFGL